ncbi:MAG: exodeoxyribonuclease III [Acidimicrobiales bacterium]
MRAASWNVNGLRARTPNLLGWLAERQPDVVGIQELRSTKRLPLHQLQQAGYFVASTDRAALLSLSPIIDIAEPTGDGRTIAGTVGGVRYVTAYAPNGTRAGTAAHQNKIDWLIEFSSVVTTQRNIADEMILLGDMNVALQPDDVWAPERYRGRNLFTDAERAAFGMVIHDNGLVDIFRDHHPGRGLYTWFNYAHESFRRRRGWRLDYILGTPGVAQRVTHAVIDVVERGRTGTSDHAPLWIDLTD